MCMQAFPKGETILRQGATVGEDDFMYLLESGDVDVVISGGHASSEAHKVCSSLHLWACIGAVLHMPHDWQSKWSSHPHLTVQALMMPLACCIAVFSLCDVCERAMHRRQADMPCVYLFGKIATHQAIHGRLKAMPSKFERPLGGCLGMSLCCLALRGLPVSLQQQTSWSGLLIAGHFSRCNPRVFGVLTCMWHTQPLCSRCSAIPNEVLL